jgi:hypothetical protein
MTAIPSVPPDASDAPPGPKATAETPSWFRLSGFPIAFPRRTSHSLTARSMLPEASRLPSSLNARLRTVPVCPDRRVTARLSTTRLPENDRVVPAAGSDVFPILAEGHRKHRIRVPSEGPSDLFPLLHVPEHHRAVEIAGDETGPVAAERESQGLRLVSVQNHAERLPARGIPDLDGRD